MLDNIKPHKLFPIALVIYEMLAYLTNDMYLPALPQISHDLAIHQHAAQLTLTAWFFGFASSSIILGPLSDRWGRRPILFIYGFIFLLATAVCALTSNIVIFLIARFFQGSVVCSITTAGYSSIHESYNTSDAIKGGSKS
jgi:MFS family permease